MNFLAHALIAADAGSAAGASSAAAAEEQALLVAGGFLGDFLKGPVPDTLPAGLARGVRLHRRIDAFSNANEAIRRSCRRFPPELRRLAPALVDVIADHLLARRWSGYHSTPLKQFSRDTYAQIGVAADHLSVDGERFLRWMEETDLLAGYASWAVTLRGMRSVTRRLRKSELDTLMAEALPALLEPLSEDFEAYFPELLEHGRDWVSAARRSS